MITYKLSLLNKIKEIKLCQYGHQFDPKEICMICNKFKKFYAKKIKLKKRSFFTRELVSCDECKITFCFKCGVHYDNNNKCINCIMNKNHKNMVNILTEYKKIINKDIIDILASYSIGCIVECCNLSCNREICINNKIHLKNYQDCNGNKIYHYCFNKKLKFINDIKTVNIYGKKRRIFCYYCTCYKLTICKHPNCCVNKEVNVNKIYNI